MRSEYENSQAKKILSTYGHNISNEESGDIEKGGVGSGRKANSLARHKLLVSAHEQAKGIHENFRKDPPKDYQGKMNHKDAENRSADTRRELREHIEKHYTEHKELLDARDHGLNEQMHKKFNKSDENDIEKGGKGFAIGQLDKSKRNVKTANGWKPVKTHGHLVKEDAEHKKETRNVFSLEEATMFYKDAEAQYHKYRDAFLQFEGEVPANFLAKMSEVDKKLAEARANYSAAFKANNKTKVETENSTILNDKQIKDLSDHINRVVNDYKGPSSKQEAKENIVSNAVDKILVDYYHKNYKEGDDYREIEATEKPKLVAALMASDHFEQREVKTHTIIKDPITETEKPSTEVEEVAHHVTETSSEYVPKVRTSTEAPRSANFKRASAIASLGSVNLKTGSSKYFNVYDTWGEDTTFQIYRMYNEYMEPGRLRLVATSGTRPIGDIGDTEAFKNDQTGRDLGIGVMIDYAVGTELKKLAKKYGNSMSGFTYK